MAVVVMIVMVVVPNPPTVWNRSLTRGRVFWVASKRFSTAAASYGRSPATVVVVVVVVVMVMVPNPSAMYLETLTHGHGCFWVVSKHLSRTAACYDRCPAAMVVVMTVEVKLSDGGSKSAWCLEALTRGRVCLEGFETCSDCRRHQKPVPSVSVDPCRGSFHRKIKISTRQFGQDWCIFVFFSSHGTYILILVGMLIFWWIPRICRTLLTVWCRSSLLVCFRLFLGYLFSFVCLRTSSAAGVLCGVFLLSRTLLRAFPSFFQRGTESPKSVFFL